ncbi:MAG: hypothetical protein KA586_02690 [Candidatus Promineofilum sp.]|nr:hypothetical protein [Promineifilum sp.]
MERQLTLRVRPGETVHFLAVCVACGQPAGERLTLQKRRGQLTRRVDVPLCAECARRLARRSGQEERLLRLSWPTAVATTLLSAILALAVLPVDSGWLRLLVGLLFGLAGGAFVRWALVRLASAAELPERRAVREAARIEDFTWRDMTLVFADGEMAERVRVMNPALVENPTPNAATETPATAAEELSV